MKIYVKHDGTIVADDEFWAKYPDAKAEIVDSKIVLKNMYDICGGSGSSISVEVYGKGVLSGGKAYGAIPSTFKVFNESFENTFANDLPRLLENNGWSWRVPDGAKYVVAYYYKYSPPVFTNDLELMDTIDRYMGKNIFSARVYRVVGSRTYNIGGSSVFKAFNTEEDALAELNYIKRHLIPKIDGVALDPDIKDILSEVDADRLSCAKEVFLFPHNIDNAHDVIDKLPKGKIKIFGLEFMSAEQRKKALDIVANVGAKAYYKNFIEVSWKFNVIYIYAQDDVIAEIIAMFLPIMDYSYYVYLENSSYSLQGKNGEFTNITMPQWWAKIIDSGIIDPQQDPDSGKYIYAFHSQDGNELHFYDERYIPGAVRVFLKVGDYKGLTETMNSRVMQLAKDIRFDLDTAADEVVAYVLDFVDDRVTISFDVQSQLTHLKSENTILANYEYELTLRKCFDNGITFKTRDVSVKDGVAAGDVYGLIWVEKILGSRARYLLTSSPNEVVFYDFPNLETTGDFGIYPIFLTKNIPLSGNRVRRFFESDANKAKELVEHAFNIDVIGMSGGIAVGEIPIDSIDVRDYFNDEEKAYLMAFATLPKRLFDAHMSLDIEQRKPDPEGVKNSINLYMNIGVFKGASHYFHLRNIGVSYYFLGYLNGVIWHDNNQDSGSPFEIEVDMDFNVNIIKNEHIDTIVSSFSGGAVAKKTYDKLLPIGYDDYALQDSGLDWSVSYKKDGDEYKYVKVEVDEQYNVIYTTWTAPAPENVAPGMEIQVNTDVTGEGNAEYTLNYNADEGVLEIDYVIRDKSGNDITDTINVLQIFDNWIHKDFASGNITIEGE